MNTMTYIVYFFFQAEDGIRDKLVTGVQTCALPIYLNAPDPRAFQDEVGQRDKQRHRQREGNGEAEIPTGPCGPRENDGADLVRDRCKRVARLEQRSGAARRWRIFLRAHRVSVFPPPNFSSSGLGLRTAAR